MKACPAKPPPYTSLIVFIRIHDEAPYRCTANVAGDIQLKLIAPAPILNIQNSIIRETHHSGLIYNLAQ